MHRNHGSPPSLTLTDLKLPQTSKHLLARVRATFSRCGLLRKPTPAVLVVENIIMSFSCPWYESIVFTGKLNEDSSGVVLRIENWNGINEPENVMMRLSAQCSLDVCLKFPPLCRIRSNYSVWMVLWIRIANDNFQQVSDKFGLVRIAIVDAVIAWLEKI